MAVVKIIPEHLLPGTKIMPEDWHKPWTPGDTVRFINVPQTASMFWCGPQGLYYMDRDEFVLAKEPFLGKVRTRVIEILCRARLYRLAQWLT